MAWTDGSIVGCSSSSTSMASSTAPPRPCPASAPCWPPEPPSVTTSSTSRTTRCTTTATTSRGSRDTGRRWARTAWSRARARAPPGSASTCPRVRTVLSVGAGGLDRELREAGFEVITAAHAATRMSQEGLDGWDAAGHPDAVVVGLDPQLTYLRIAAAADCVRAGAVFVATNRDPVYPTERGFRPGAGAVVAAIETAGRRHPRSRSASPGPTCWRRPRDGRRRPGACGDDRRLALGRGRGPGRRRAHDPDADRGHEPRDRRRAPARRASHAHRRRRRRAGAVLEDLAAG